MSSSYTLLVPLMLVSTISFLLLAKVTLYEKQMLNRLASPAHIGEFARGLLDRMTVRDAARKKPVSVIAENMLGAGDGEGREVQIPAELGEALAAVFSEPAYASLRGGLFRLDQGHGTIQVPAVSFHR